MKWIELNDGRLINLEKVELISVEERTKKSIVCYETNSDLNKEIFETLEEAENRMNMLKQMLI